MSICLYAAPFQEGAAGSHRLLLRAAGRYTGENTAGWSIQTHSRGKPFFPEHPRVCFSITHSGRYWLCAFSHENVGLDLQLHQKPERLEWLSRHFFHPDEDTFLRRRAYTPFFDLWAAKESWLKYTGRGITQGLDDFSLVTPAGEFPSAPQAQLRLLPWSPGYSLCLCARQIGTVGMEML